MINNLKITAALIRRSRPDFQFKAFNDSPITPLNKPLQECKLAIITTGGIHLKSDIPFYMKEPGGDCSYRTIPYDIEDNAFRVSHKWYNHKFINSDINCVFPIDRMREYARKGVIGALSEKHYSFMGHIYETGPLVKNVKKVGDRLKKLNVDIAFLTPT
ncbi:MAG: glycine/sarcosine/betaine reductase selenoprotein B family protein [Nitrospirota bacterium]